MYLQQLYDTGTIDDDRTLTAQSTTRSFFIANRTEEARGNTTVTYIAVVSHFIKGYVGCGVFAMGMAFKSCGIILGPFLLILLALIILHCQHLIIRACARIIKKEPVDVLPTLSETVVYTLADSRSPWFRQRSYRFGLITDFFVAFTECGCCMVYFIFIARHIGEFAAVHGWKYDYRIILFVTLIPMYMLSYLGNLKYMALISSTANILLLIGIILLLYYSSEELPPFNERDYVAHKEKIPMFLGIILFSFQGMTFVFPFAMEAKGGVVFISARRIVSTSILVCTSLYVVVGVLNYWKWGGDIAGSSLLNLQQQKILTQAANVFVTVSVMLSYVINLYETFGLLYLRSSGIWGPFSRPILVALIMKIVIVVVIYSLANISPKISTMMSLVGTISGTIISLLLPTVLELIMLYGELTYFIIVKDMLIIIAAIAVTFSGTILSIVDIVCQYENEECD